MKYSGDKDLIWVEEKIPYCVLQFGLEDDFYGLLDDSIEDLLEVKERAQQHGYRSISVRREDYYHLWEDTPRLGFVFYGERKETDEERVIRLENYEDELQGIKNAQILAEQAKKRQEEDERKLYEELKKKYEVEE